MKIGIIGTGYVGLPTGVGLAEMGHTVICVDKDESKIKELQASRPTLYEDGLNDLFIKNCHEGKLSFTSSMKEGVSEANVVIIAVGTPSKYQSEAPDLQFLYQAADEIAVYLRDYTVIAIKSTVPVGTGDKIERRIAQIAPQCDYDVVSLPEFLREGFAMHDFLHPDRIVVGTESKRARNVIRRMYEPLLKETKILEVARRSSEVIKYAANAFLAVKIHYINEIADFCEKVGAEISEVTMGMGSDPRIGSRFLCPGPGYGGSCFPKDTKALVYMAEKANADMSLVRVTIEGNEQRSTTMAKKILQEVKDVSRPKIAILGLAFKGGTDDCRESPAIKVVSQLLNEDVIVQVYDPKAMINARKLLGERVEYAKDAYEAMTGADVTAILTEWSEFANIDWGKAAHLVHRKIVVDCRNIIHIQDIKQKGYKLRRIGGKD